MHWTYDELLALPAEVYDVLISHLSAEAAQAEQNDQWP
jgi:hypothetical protein